MAFGIWHLASGLGVGYGRGCAQNANTAHPLTPSPHHPIIIKAARILTVTQGTIENGVLVIRDGKIAAIGKQGEVALPADAEVIDASGMWVMPGQIDLHTHIGNNSGLHDYVHSLNPAFHVWEYIDPGRFPSEGLRSPAASRPSIRYRAAVATTPGSA